MYAHQPHLAANWISADDAAKHMITCLDRPDFEGSWMNLGGPERLLPTEIASKLSKAVGREVVYDPCTPEEFGEYFANAFSRHLSEKQARNHARWVAEFYHFNNSAEIKPFEVDVNYQQFRLPVELVPFDQWAARQDWHKTKAAVRAPAG